MMTEKFLKGDIIRCTNDARSNFITQGQIYEVTEVSASGSCVYIKDNDGDNWDVYGTCGGEWELVHRPSFSKTSRVKRAVVTLSLGDCVVTQGDPDTFNFSGLRSSMTREKVSELCDLLLAVLAEPTWKPEAPPEAPTSD